MKECPKCKTEHNKSGTFCSRKCANSRIFSDEAKLKKSIASKKNYVKPIYDKEMQALKSKDTWNKKYHETPFDKLGMDNKRKRVFEEQNFCCSKCGISEWLGNPLSLELEHKDGNNKNNARDNLEGLCPNCHSQTSTWRGRNKAVNKITDDDLLKCLLETTSIRQGLLNAGLTAKGDNYDRAS